MLLRHIKYIYAQLLGYRMPASDGTPDEIHRLMLRCWEYEPEKRPHFDQIYAVVETLSQAYL